MYDSVMVPKSLCSESPAFASTVLQSVRKC